MSDVGYIYVGSMVGLVRHPLMYTFDLMYTFIYVSYQTLA